MGRTDRDWPPVLASSFNRVVTRYLAWTRRIARITPTRWSFTTTVAPSWQRRSRPRCSCLHRRCAPAPAQVLRIFVSCLGVATPDNGVWVAGDPRICAASGDDAKDRDKDDEL